MEVFGIAIGILLFLVGIPLIGYILAKNSFGGGSYNKNNNDSKKDGTL